jgi:aspartate dehydrogenase
MRVAVIGAGAIGRWLIEGLRRDGLAPAAVIVRRAPPGDVAAVGSVGALPAGVTHLVDCAGHSGLAAHGPAALAAGIDVVTLSLGALADAALAAELASAADAGGARLHLASGAIGGLDALRAAAAGGLTAVRYTGTKPPAGWAGSPAEAVLDLDALSGPALHFDGTARAAAQRYPRNANVAAAVALAGLGFDATRARLVADPAADGNTHLVEAEGAFGRFRFEITGAALPETPGSSALAAMSALAEIRRLRARVST